MFRQKRTIQGVNLRHHLLKVVDGINTLDLEYNLLIDYMDLDKLKQEKPVMLKVLLQGMEDIQALKHEIALLEKHYTGFVNVNLQKTGE